MTKKNDFKLTLSLSFGHASEDTRGLHDRINEVLNPDAQQGLKTIMELILAKMDVEEYTLNVRTEKK
jgi:hypothetical protein